MKQQNTKLKIRSDATNRWHEELTWLYGSLARIWLLGSLLWHFEKRSKLHDGRIFKASTNHRPVHNTTQTARPMTPKHTQTTTWFNFISFRCSTAGQKLNTRIKVKTTIYTQNTSCLLTVDLCNFCSISQTTAFKVKISFLLNALMLNYKYQSRTDYKS